MNKEQEKIYNELISKYNFNRQQKEEIELGLKRSVDVSIYLNPEFNRYQMQEIRNGIELNLDVSLYAIPNFDFLQMEEIRLGL